MSQPKRQSKSLGRVIAVNRRARHDYFIEDRFEGGLALEGWEVKALRAGRLQLQEGYVIKHEGEIWLLGALITPLPSVSTHIVPDPRRTRKVLLHRREIDRLIGKVDQQGYTMVPLSMYWQKGMAKLEFALAKGKKKYDKRQSKKDEDWQRRKRQLLRH
jgi:SsrA-binding protein